MPRSRLLILADDLTGSADSGVFFARSGLRTTIALDGSGPDPDDPVLIVDTDCREADARTAQALTAAAVRRYAADRLLFVKIDSTLRGPIGAVVSAVGGPILCAPAFPAAGRTTVGGRQLDAGRPLSESPAWHGHPGPAPADIAAALAPVPSTVVDAAFLASQFAAHPEVAVVCDATTDADLTRIARAGLAVTPIPTFVGTGGLAAALAREMPAGAGIASMARSGPALVVVGSTSGTAREQAKSLAAAGFAPVEVPATDLAAAGCLTLRGDTVVSVSGPVRPADRAVVVRGLAAAVAPAARQAALLALTGGQTARAVLTRAGARALRLQDEVDPGVVLSQVDWGDGAETTLITKAGGFGDATTLVRAIRQVRTKG